MTHRVVLGFPKAPFRLVKLCFHTGACRNSPFKPMKDDQSVPCVRGDSVSFSVFGLQGLRYNCSKLRLRTDIGSTHSEYAIHVRPHITKVIVMSHFKLGRTEKGEIVIGQYVI